jgi:hypothetical protein
MSPPSERGAAGGRGGGTTAPLRQQPLGAGIRPSRLRTLRVARVHATARRAWGACCTSIGISTPRTCRKSRNASTS